MKATRFFLFLALTIFSLQGNAVVKVPGTFIPSECGESQSIEGQPVTVSEVCIGQLTGSHEAAVTFEFSSEELQVFRVARMASLLVALRSGDIMTNYYLIDENGIQTTMKVVKSRDGFVKSVAGKVHGVDYHVPAMETVFTIQ